MPLMGSSAVQSFWSERLQQELQLEALRPSGLPSPSDDGALPVQDAWRVGEGRTETGKGRGMANLANGSMGMLTTPMGPPMSMGPPPQVLQSLGPTPMGVQSQGVMPSETAGSLQTMGPLNGHVKRDDGRETVDPLQRGLEVELVDFLRRQNAKLIGEVELLKEKLEAKSGSGVESSPWSTVNGDSVDGHGPSAHPGKRWASRSPRPTKRAFETPEQQAGMDVGRVKNVNQLQLIPNGTRIPDGPPPNDDSNMIPTSPPVPPFPQPPADSVTAAASAPMNLDDYEACANGSKTKMGDVGWKPACERAVTPQEAKTMWLEREVQSLKTVLEKVAGGKTYDIDKAWPLKHGQTVWSADLPEPRVESAMMSGGSGALHSTAHGDAALQARAASGALHSTVHGDVALQARAASGALHSTGLGDGSQQDRALHGTVLGDLSQQGRALRGTVLGDGALQASTLHGTVLGDDPLQARALRATPTAGLHGDPHGQGQHGSMGVNPVPSSWEPSGGGTGGIA